MLSCHFIVCRLSASDDVRQQSSVVSRVSERFNLFIFAIVATCTSGNKGAMMMGNFMLRHVMEVGVKITIFRFHFCDEMMALLFFLGILNI